jgi:hypothetical protein|tara:strand:- start:419 stop:643 length:225 start_codon:yes stop_codon:yes gene_type:complete
MRTRGFNKATEEIMKILKREGPKSTSELKHLLELTPHLKNTCITSNRIAQYMRRKPFVVVDRNANRTKIYAVEE